MAKSKQPYRSGGRQRYRYVGLPVDLYAKLKQFADADERTVMAVAKRAVREFLARTPPPSPPSAGNPSPT